VKTFLKNIFLERLLFISKSFYNFGKICTRFSNQVDLGKKKVFFLIDSIFSNRVQVGKGMFYRFYFLKTQSFLFLFNKVLHGFKPCSIGKRNVLLIDFIFLEHKLSFS